MNKFFGQPLLVCLQNGEKIGKNRHRRLLPIFNHCEFSFFTELAYSSSLDFNKFTSYSGPRLLKILAKKLKLITPNADTLAKLLKCNKRRKPKFRLTLYEVTSYHNNGERQLN